MTNHHEHLDPDEVPAWLATLWPRRIDDRIVAGVNDDDCAVLKWGGELLVVTTDYLNARPIALQLGLGTVADLGRLAVAANLSDLCGSGAEPRALLIAVMMKRESRAEDFRSLMLGVQAEARRWHVPVVGGDTKLGDCTAILGIALGAAPASINLFLKNSAKSGDGLWVSGALGSCNAAVLGLTKGGMSEEWQAWARDAILIPTLPLERSRALSSAGIANGGVDVSDGLGSDLRKLCEASHVGAVLEVDGIPVDPHVVHVASSLGFPPWTLALGCGGDFQFVASAPEKAAAHMKRMGFARIGTITDGASLQLKLPTGSMVALPGQGHRDARNLSFADEILMLVSEVAKLVREAR